MHLRTCRTFMAPRVHPRTVVGRILRYPDIRPAPDRAAVRELPDAERRQAYGATLEAFRIVCTIARPGLDEYCRDQARFLLRFAECDDGCRIATGRYASIGRR